MGIVLLILNVIKTKLGKTKLDNSCNQLPKTQEGKDSELNKAASSSQGRCKGEGSLQLCLLCSHTSLGQDTGFRLKLPDKKMLHNLFRQLTPITDKEVKALMRKMLSQSYLAC